MSMLFATPLISDQNRPSPQHWSTLKQPVFPSPPPSQYNEENVSSSSLSTTSLYPLATNPASFDFLPAQQSSYASSPSLMPTDAASSAWLSTGQLTPTSSSRTHHRESSLSSLGSVGPASPYAGNTSNPQVAGDLYHDYTGMANSFLPSDHNTKPLTPEHTPLQEQFLSPHYAFYGANAQPAPHSNLKRVVGDAELMPRVARGHDSTSSTPPPYASADRQKNAYRSAMPKLDRTMSDVYRDELYNPNLHFTSAATPAPTQALTAAVPQNDVFTQRLLAANASHRTPLVLPSRERSPFRQGSPLAPPSADAFGARQMFGTAAHIREQQKAESDARALQQQLERASPEHAAPKTVSPKDVDLVYHESEADAKMPLFSQPQQSAPNYRRREASELDDAASQHSYGSMATSRRESASAYSQSSHATPQTQFSFAPPAVAGSVRQPYSFVSPSARKPSDISNPTDDFPATLASMESSNSEYTPDADRRRRAAAADTGTYTCTYHGCTLRFETPAKLQRHKREGHRNAGAWIGTTGDDSDRTAAVHNTQAGPHRCERINPSTGKPCNTVFSRPYDLTRHEDTIHNARKQKVRCHLCTEEKSFSRNDALTRHFRVCHPDHVDPSKSRRRGGR